VERRGIVVYIKGRAAALGHLLFDRKKKPRGQSRRRGKRAAKKGTCVTCVDIKKREKCPREKKENGGRDGSVFA